MKIFNVMFKNFKIVIFSIDRKHLQDIRHETNQINTKSDNDIIIAVSCWYNVKLHDLSRMDPTPTLSDGPFNS